MPLWASAFCWAVAGGIAVGMIAAGVVVGVRTYREDREWHEDGDYYG